jgi:anhydro-N-acetylmuramic acid kinase
VNSIGQLLQKLGIKPQEVCAIGAHGQTLFHSPPLTIQWLDPALVAQAVRIDVVADFRRADCAAGGQGAPLVPYADQVLFGSETESQVILNIGGIANITLLPKVVSGDPVIGYDTGPGNCVSDWLMRDDGGVDIHGARALSGTVSTKAVETLLNALYFAKSPPKSTDGPAMLAIWSDVIDPKMPLNDQLATAAMWVGQSVRKSLDQHRADRLIVCGGGTRNRAIMQYLPEATAPADFGVPTQAREAMAFAILASTTIDRVPGNVRSVTGANRGVVLGAVYPHA